VYRVIVALILSICTANVSLTWGVKGHKVVGVIAMVHLTDSARQQVENLLVSDLQQFIEVATWADEARFQRRGTLETFLSMAFVTKLPETAEIKWLAYLATVLNEASFNRCWRVTISVSEFVRMDRNSRTGTGALRNDGEAHEKADRGFK